MSLDQLKLIQRRIEQNHEGYNARLVGPPGTLADYSAYMYELGKLHGSNEAHGVVTEVIRDIMSQDDPSDDDEDGWSDPLEVEEFDDEAVVQPAPRGE